MNTQLHASEELRLAVSKPEADINLAEAALVFAKSEYPDLDVQRYLKQLDGMASVVDKRLPADSSFATSILQLNHFLFDEQGFSGNTEEYYDPRNSFLNQVLERRTGIPVTLSLVYMEVGRRLGLPLVGVMFPGHFLVKMKVGEGNVVLDPFLRGLSLTEEDLANRLRQMTDVNAKSTLDVSEVLATASKTETLMRLFRNLKSIYLRAEEHTKALNVIQQMLAVQPEDANEIRDRGYVYQRLECFGAARDDFEHYLEQRPDSLDAVDIRKQLVAMREAYSRLH